MAHCMPRSTHRISYRSTLSKVTRSLSRAFMVQASISGLFARGVASSESKLGPEEAPGVSRAMSRHEQLFSLVA
jgi:hypothetical protein